MENLLYYPYINLPKSDWTARILIYYNHVGSIVPDQYLYEPNNFDPEMQDMVRRGLVNPINPMVILDNPQRIGEIFLNYISRNEVKIRRRRNNFLRYNSLVKNEKFANGSYQIHTGKFDGQILYSLAELGLASKIDHNWYRVERQTAHELMRYLAEIVGRKIDYQPITDKITPVAYSIAGRHKYDNDDVRIFIGEHKRHLILKELIPFPEEINLDKLQSFKDRHHDLLLRFRNQVELIVIDPYIDVHSRLFNERLNELKFQKEELTNRMNESRFGPIFFGSICGVLSASLAISTEGPASFAGAIGSISTLSHAVYSALRIERSVNLPDPSGLKYLALIDRKLRGYNRRR